MIAEKAIIPDRLRATFRRIIEGAGSLLPREATPEEQERYRLAHEPREAAELRKHQSEIKTRLVALDAQFKERVDPLCDQVIAGDISPTQFLMRMKTEVQYNVLAGAAIGSNGIGALTRADIDRVDARVREEYSYLARWVAQLERTPDQERSAAAMKVRAHLYGGSAHIAAAEALDQNQMKAFPNLPVYPKTRSVCRKFCACDWEWVNVDHVKGDADIYWRLNATREVVTEHCEQCLRRSAAFNPLQIRAWQFVNLPSDLTPYFSE